MESVFPIVVFGAVALSLVMSVAFLVSRGSLYDQIGQGGLSPGNEPPGQAGPVPDSLAGRAEREREVRQMLNARSERMVSRGQPALDVDAEVARLLGAPGGDSGGAREAGLVAEVRQLVVARNERRRRQGLDPLDVEEETERTLAELDP